MKKLLLLIILLISYGSLYPFDFQPMTLADALHRIYPVEYDRASYIGDILANIIIFLPFGFTGYFALSGSPVMRVALVVLLSIVVGFGLQVLQVYLPIRDPSLFDGLLNVFGACAGILAAAFSSALMGRIPAIKGPSAFLCC